MSKSKTEIKILKSAKDLFWKYGFKRVTVEEICKEASVSKMSFYRLFKNKKAIASQLINLEIKNSLDEFKSIYESHEPFIEKMEMIIHLKLKYSDNMSYEFINDFFNHADSEFHQSMHNKKEESVKMTMDFFRKAQQEGHIRKDLNLDIVPILSENITQMATNDQLLQIYSSPKDLIKELTTFFFYGIISHPKHP